MLKFNNDHIFTGYIKQLLTSFNLPKYRIYTKEQQEYHRWVEEHKLESGFEKIPNEKNIISTVFTGKHPRYILYIKDNQIGYFTTDKDYIEYKWHSYIKTYFYNKKELNYTKNLKITNNIYDSYTHEYLGDYLRFQRDYNNFNLMSLYNCFSNNVCSNLSYSWTIEKESSTKNESGTTTVIKFDTTDSNYKIYMLPVKLFKQYTIAIDSAAPVEICCGIYGKYQDTRIKLKHIPSLTYQKFGSLNFNKPVLYEKLVLLTEELYQESETELAQNEDNLKMFIKLPASNASSIVVLEGDYLNFNDSIYKKFNRYTESGSIESGKYYPYFDRRTNHFITNFEGPVEGKKHESGEEYNDHTGYQEGQYFNPITPLQLLRINTKFNYPFADRLIEYLLGNVVTDKDELIDNIIRTQTVLGYNKELFKSEGVRESKMNPLLYNFINNHIETDPETKKIININSKYNRNDINHDILGYVDKDVEKYYYGIDSKGNTQTISSIDIYDNMYNKEEK